MPRAEERLAMKVIGSVLPGAVVALHDDNSSAGLFDLTLTYPDGLSAAVEVTTATDGVITAQWEAIRRPSARWIDGSLVGGWRVCLRPGIDIRRVRSQLPHLLRRLEADGTTMVIVDGSCRGEHHEAARRIGATYLFQSETDHPGSIYPDIELPLDRSGGWEQPTVNAIAEWIGEFLRAPEQEDNLRKLAISTRTERHLFVILHTFTTAPFTVSGPLMFDDQRVPVVAPSLPGQVTHLWMMSAWSSGGIRWDPTTGWARYVIDTGATT